MANGDKYLTPAEVYDLREFVLDVLNIIKSDVEGVTLDLEEGAQTAAEILGITDVDIEDNDDDTSSYT